MPRLFSARIVLFLLIVILMDLTLSPVFALGRLQFILSYLLVVYAAFQWGWKTTMPIAILVGISRELVGGELMGLEICSMIISAFGLDLIVQKLQRESILLRMGTVFLFVLVASGTKFILTLFLTSTHLNFWYYGVTLVGSGIYTAIIFPIFYFLAAKWFHDRINFKQYELFG